jgi:hypothetical protein
VGVAQLGKSMTHTLLCLEKKSGKGVIYGKYGDPVKLISDKHGEVYIVENKAGQRFSINKSLVQAISK